MQMEVCVHDRLYPTIKVATFRLRGKIYYSKTCQMQTLLIADTSEMRTLYLGTDRFYYINTLDIADTSLLGTGTVIFGPKRTKTLRNTDTRACPELEKQRISLAFDR